MTKWEVFWGHSVVLGGIALAAQVIPLISTHFFLAWSVIRLSVVCLSHSCLLLIVFFYFFLPLVMYKAFQNASGSLYMSIFHNLLDIGRRR